MTLLDAVGQYVMLSDNVCDCMQEMIKDIERLNKEVQDDVTKI